MKIAMMTNNYKPFIGGVPISVERLAKGLRRQGHEVTVFAPAYKEQEEEADTIRYRSLLEGIAGGVVIPSPIDLRIEKEFRKGKYDIIHVHHPMLIGKTAVYLSRKYGVPLVFTYHTRYEQYLHYCLPEPLLKQKQFAGFTEKVVTKYLHAFMKNCSHIFVPTAGMKSYLTDACLYEGTVSVLPTGLEDEQYQISAQEVSVVRRKFDAEGMPLFCSVSRMAHEKNVPFLLESISRFSEKYNGPFKVLLIGEGPNRGEYEQKCRELGIGEHVIFTGKIPNDQLVNYYGACDAFLFASKTETQGIVLLEAFAAGIPVIGVEASGVSDLVEDGMNGFLVPEDMDIFSDRMLIPVTDADWMQRLGEGACRTAMRYTESEVAKTAADRYNRVVKKYRSEHDAEKREAEKWKISIVS